MSKRVKQQSTRSPEGAPSETPADMQRTNSGGQDGRGRFAKGNSYAFKPGQSGNRRGRPKSALLSDVFRRMLAETCPDDEQGRTWAEVIAERMLVAAAGGDVRAAKEIADRVEGKAQQHITLSYETRELYERTIKEIMEASGCTREEAIRTLALYKPDAMSLLVN